MSIAGSGGRGSGRSTAGRPTCEHLSTIEPDAAGRLGPPPSSDGCEDCLRIGATWVHLRRCLTCGHVGCCDDSPNRHARAHAGTSSHAVVQSFEPGEDWLHCFAHELTRPSPVAVPSPSRP